MRKTGRFFINENGVQHESEMRVTAPIADKPAAIEEKPAPVLKAVTPLGTSKAEPLPEPASKVTPIKPINQEVV